MIIYENATYKIQRFVSGMLDNNSYLISSAKTNKSIIIDILDNPRDLFSKIPRDRINKLNNIKKSIGVITHGHFDQIEGIDFIKDRLGEIEIQIGFEDSKYLNYSGKITKLRSQKEITHGDIKLEVLYTPGHTQGSICLYFDLDEKKFLFSGDTLYQGGPGKTTNFLNFKKIYESISNKIYKLPKETIILPGHGSEISIAESIGEFNHFKLSGHIYGDITWKI